MPLELDLALQPKQWDFLSLCEATGYDAATTLGYGGALGGGKSHAIRNIMLARRVQHPGTTGVIIRRVFEDIKNNHIDPFFAAYPELRPYYRISDHELTLPGCGSRIKFMYAESSEEVIRKFTGIEFYDMFVDQAEQFKESDLRVMKTRNRWPNTQVGECKTGLFFNPGGPGAEYLRRVFYLNQYKEGERRSDYAFIHAFGWDNYYWVKPAGLISEQDYYYKLTDAERFQMFIEDSQYGRELNSLPPSLRAGHLLGSFVAFEGQYFAGVWDESKCILGISDAESLIQPWWTRWCSTDWGFAHHSCHLWFATGLIKPSVAEQYLGCITEYPIKVVVVYRELAVRETAEEDLAQQIVDLTGDEHIEATYLSPDAFAKKGSANTVAEQLISVFQRNDYPLPEPADNDRVGGWRLLYGGLRQTCSMRGEVITREQAEAGAMLLISSNCPQVISAIPIAIRDPKAMEDVLKVNSNDSATDDVLDCLRYGYKSYLAPRKKAPQAVRALETWAAAAPNPTSRAMAMKKFEEAEKRASGNMRLRRVRIR